MMNRRSFLKKTAVASVAAISIPNIVKAAIPDALGTNETAWHFFSQGETILFQGDSITDSGRNRGDENNANQQSMLGHGYPLFAAAKMLAVHPDKELKIYNRGISGNKVFELRDRWDKDCIELNPKVVSILIGVNDYWHKKSFGYDGTVDVYERDYRDLLKKTRHALPGVQLVVCEPFLIHGGSALDDSWETEFAPYRKIAKKLAVEHDAIFVPYQTVFNEALKTAPATYWGADGVHPSMAGAQLMAEAWLKAVSLA